MTATSTAPATPTGSPGSTADVAGLVDDLLDLLGPDAVHNGLLAEADPLEAPDLSDLPAEGIVLVLDQITDPHNVGAILRSAAAFAAAPYRPEPHPALEQHLDRPASQQDEKADEHDNEAE